MTSNIIDGRKLLAELKRRWNGEGIIGHACALNNCTAYADGLHTAIRCVEDALEDVRIDLAPEHLPEAILPEPVSVDAEKRCYHCQSPMTRNGNGLLTCTNKRCGSHIPAGKPVSVADEAADLRW